MKKQFNASAYEVSDSKFSRFPLGWYLVKITDEEEIVDAERTKLRFTLEALQTMPARDQDRTPEYIAKLEAMKGEFKLWNFNLVNPEPTTVKIAEQTMAKLSFVVGCPQWSDTRQLHNIPFWALIGPQKKNPDYDDVFELKSQSGETPLQLRDKFLGHRPHTVAQPTPISSGIKAQPKESTISASSVALAEDATASPSNSVPTPPWLLGKK